jgi:hypothetical protein
MPRQIIDTESSRPRYVRRLALTYVLVVLAVVALLAAGYAVWASHRAARGGNTPSARVSWQPSITAPALPPESPKESPCCVA